MTMPYLMVEPDRIFPVGRVVFLQSAPFFVRSKGTSATRRPWRSAIAVIGQPSETVVTSESPLDERILIHDPWEQRVLHALHLIPGDTDDGCDEVFLRPLTFSETGKFALFLYERL